MLKEKATRQLISQIFFDSAFKVAFSPTCMASIYQPKTVFDLSIATVQQQSAISSDIFFLDKILNWKIDSR